MKNPKGPPRNKPAGGAAPPPLRGLIGWLLLLLVVMTVVQYFTQGQARPRMLPYYPDFVQKVEDGRVQECEIVMEASGSQHVRGTLLEDGEPETFRVEVLVTEDLLGWLREHRVPFSFKSPSPYLWQILSGAIPFLLFIGLLYFLFARQMRMAGRGAMSFGKSRARLLTREHNRVKFESVAGIQEAKEEVQEIIEFLRDPRRFQKLGGRIPKGVMLIGPPGTGKTLLARAIAGEAEVPFFTISGSDFIEMFVGVGASRVRDMFEQGKKSAPCIIFIDEIDAVGRSRFSGIGGGHDEREQTLNALLVEMDGFETQEGVIIVAATNRPDVLDPALLRPGRFDRQIMVDLPDQEGREAILRIHAKRVKLQDAEDLKVVARGTPGFSGADLANMLNEAALLAARRGAPAITLHDMEEARDKVRWGRERRSRRLDDKEKRLTAFHEAGHAIVLELLEETEPLHKVTIIPRGASLGSTMQLPEKDRYTRSRKSLMDMITGLMGGRAAEELVFGDITTGAQSDLQQATRLARLMVCDWGMSEELGPQSFGNNEELLFLGREVSRSQEHSEETSRIIDREVARLLRQAHARAQEILSARRASLEALASLLLERETLDGREVKEILKHGCLPPRKDTGENPAASERAAAADGPAPQAAKSAPPAVPPFAQPAEAAGPA